jgi:competence protein ComEA
MMHAAEMNPQGPTESETHNEAAPPISQDRSGSGEGRKGLALSGRLRARWTESIWWPLLTRGAAVLATMGTLAFVGAQSAEKPPGVPLAPSASDTQVAGVWLAPSRPSARGSESHPTTGRGDTPRPARPRSDVPPANGATEPGATTVQEPSQASSAPKSPAPGVTADGKVVLNTATETELTRLPRVGPKRAAAIVALRKRLGRFRKATDLLRVRGIGVKTLRKMLPHLVVDAPADG